MSTVITVINTPGSNIYTAPATLVGGSVTVACYGAMGNGEPAPFAGPAGWPQGTTTGGRGSLINATVTIGAGGTLTCWVGDAAGHGYHPGGVGSAAGGGGQTGFQGGGSSAVITTGATPTLLLEAAGGGGAGGNAYTNFGSAKGGYGGKVFGAGYNGGVTPHTACFGGGGGGGGGNQGVGAAGLNTHTSHGGTVVGAGGDNGINRTGVAGGGGGGAGGRSFAATTGLSSVQFADAIGATTLGSVSFWARVADPPLAPTQAGPYNGMYVDATAPITFAWAYNAAPDSGSQNAYALRVALDGGAYRYWNATTGALQSSLVWNTSSSTSVILPANLIANGHIVTWSVATQESHYSLQGPFAANFSFLSGVTFKWQLIDPVAGEAYAFEINPNTGGSLSRQKNVTSYTTTADDSQVVLYEGADQPQAVQVSGTLLTETQYQAMVYWYSKRRQVLLIDDLGRNIWVYFNQFQPTRKRTIHYPWRHEWQAQFYVMGPQTVTTL